MTERILLATRNDGKVAELRRILAASLPRLEVVGLGDVPAYPDAPETGATFAENALAKARDGFANTGLATVADDSGLAVDALNGMPGVLSARWSGQHGQDEANLHLVLAQLRDTPDTRLRAEFVCATALVDDSGERVFEATMRGRLVRTPRGDQGFGYDPIFVPDGFDRTSAELSPAEKDEISHRGKALRLLAAYLSQPDGIGR